MINFSDRGGMGSAGSQTRPGLAPALCRALADEETARSAGGADEPPPKRARLSRPPGPPVPPLPEMIGAGHAGCVFSPPLQCSASALGFAGDSTKASKYSTWREVRREAVAYRAVDRADPGFAFHLRTYGTCRADTLPSCSDDYLRGWAPDEPRGILIMDRAGPSLSQLMLGGGGDEDVDYAANAAHLAAAVEAMAREGIVYGDLHAGNLVLGADGLLRIVDFGQVGYATPEEALALLPANLCAVRDVFADVLAHRPEIRAQRPDQFARLQAFVGPGPYGDDERQGR